MAVKARSDVITLIRVNDGAKGDKGDKGATGPQGPKGQQGPQGESGIDLSNGKMLYTDPYFAFSNNSCVVYNNLNNGNVKIERVGISSDNPFSATSVTSYELKIINTGTSHPGCGGFCWANASRANAIFIYRIIAKIPTGRHLIWTTNLRGNNPSEKWLTSNDGTGKFTEYIFKLICGSTGTFHSTGFFRIDGSTGTTDNPIEWRVAYATCFDMTSRSDVTTALITADGKNKTVYSENADPSSTSGYKSGDVWFNKSTGGIWQFDGSKWNPHQVGTTSIANGAITADKVAANAINAQKINVDTLSAISANLGSITAGDINGVTITGSDFVFADASPDKGLKGSDGYNKLAFCHTKLLLSPVKTNEDFFPEMRCVLTMDEKGNVGYVNKSGAYSFGYVVNSGSFRFLNKNGLGTGINSIAIGSEKEHTISFGWTGSRLRPVIDGNQIYMPVIDTIFYNPNNGMGSGVSLTSAATDYDALDIFCKTDDGTQIYTKVCNPTVGTTFEVSVNHIAAGGGNMWIKTKQFKISSSTYITTASSGSSYFTGNVRISSNSIPATVSQSDNITIIKVVGWKY